LSPESALFPNEGEQGDLGNDDVVVICTMNRPNELGYLTEYLREKLGWCAAILIVDASTEKAAIDKIDGIVASQKLRLIRTEPGLPGQRNRALEYAKRHFQSGHIVHFLDDDVIPSTSYFAEATRLIQSAPKNCPRIVGSEDSLLKRSWSGSALRRIGLKGNAGRVSAFGLSSPPEADSSRNQWTPGHGFSFRPADFPDFLFDSTIDFFGEDIEATLRLGIEGNICLGKGSTLLHVPGNRQGSGLMYDLRELELRLSLARRFPEIVVRRLVLSAFFVEALLLFALPTLPFKIRAGLALSRFKLLSIHLPKSHT